MSTTGTSGTLSRLVPGARRQAARTWRGLALCIEAAEHQQQQDTIAACAPAVPAVRHVGLGGEGVARQIELQGITARPRREAGYSWPLRRPEENENKDGLAQARFVRRQATPEESCVSRGRSSSSSRHQL